MRSVALAVVFILLLSLGASPIAAAAGGPHSGSQLAAGDAQPAALPAIESGGTPPLPLSTHSTPSTTFTINLQSDRSADWEVTVAYELTTEAERAAFRETAAEFEDGSTAGGLDVSLYENMAALASDRTGREMEIQSVDRSSSLRGNVGTLTLSFRWTEFLDADGEQLVFNDALRTPDGNSWLTSLNENQELRITTPRGYAITSANVGFSDNTVVVTGPHTFDAENHISIRLEPSLGPSWGLLGAAVVIGMAIVGGALLLRRRDEPADEGPQPNTNGGVETAERPDDGGSEPPAEADEGGSEPSTADEGEEDLSLLADDERVLRLLDRNGGRMRQADIVSETKWSDAKVSQLLSSMADDGEIKKLRIGRENLISLPHVDALDGSVSDEDDEQ